MRLDSKHLITAQVEDRNYRANLTAFQSKLQARPVEVALAREWISELIRLRSRTAKGMSTEAMATAIEDVIASHRNSGTYLPGCSPTWNPKTLVELAQDYAQQGHPSSMLGNVIGNLKAIDLARLETILDRLDELEGDNPHAPVPQDLVAELDVWKSNAFRTSLFEELATRIPPRGKPSSRTGEELIGVRERKPRKAPLRPPRPKSPEVRILDALKNDQELPTLESDPEAFDFLIGLSFNRSKWPAGLRGRFAQKIFDAKYAYLVTLWGTQPSVIRFFAQHKRLPKASDSAAMRKYIDRILDAPGPLPHGFPKDMVQALEELRLKKTARAENGKPLDRLARILADGGSLQGFSSNDWALYQWVRNLPDDPDLWPDMELWLKQALYEQRFGKPLPQSDSDARKVAISKILWKLEQGHPLPLKKTDAGVHDFILSLPEDVSKWPEEFRGDAASAIAVYRQVELARPLRRIQDFYAEHGRLPTRDEDPAAYHHYAQVIPDDPEEWPPELRLEIQGGLREVVLTYKASKGRDSKVAVRLQEFFAQNGRLPRGREDFNLYSFLWRLNTDPKPWPPIIQGDLKSEVIAFKAQQAIRRAKKDPVMRVLDFYTRHQRLPTHREDHNIRDYLNSLPRDPSRWPEEFQGPLREILLVTLKHGVNALKTTPDAMAKRKAAHRKKMTGAEPPNQD